MLRGVFCECIQEGLYFLFLLAYHPVIFFPKMEFEGDPADNPFSFSNFKAEPKKAKPRKSKPGLNGTFLSFSPSQAIDLEDDVPFPDDPEGTNGGGSNQQTATHNTDPKDNPFSFKSFISGEKDQAKAEVLFHLFFFQQMWRAVVTLH